MKVVQALGWYFPDSIGGTEIYVSAVARELRRAGVDVRIAAPRAGASDVSVYEHDSVPVYRYPIPAAPTRAEARGDCAVRGSQCFHDWLRAERPDIVHVHTFVTGLDLVEIEEAAAAGARVFLTSHSSALGYVCLRGTLRRWGTEACDGVVRPHRCAACALHHRGVPRALAHTLAALPPGLASIADGLDHPLGTAVGLPAYVQRRIRRQHALFERTEIFFALTNAARDILVSNGAPSQKVRVNQLGVDVTGLGEPKPRRARYRGHDDAAVTIGYLGRFDPIKGIDDLLRAARSLDPDVKFRLQIRGIGNDDDARSVREACEAAARLDARITVAGAVERQRVAQQLASWDVLCCPGVALEGGPTVALEAMAVGTPVIGTDFGGLAELVTDGVNGRLFAPGDWRALAEIIRSLADRPGLLEDWRTRLPAVRSMQHVAAEYLSAYSVALSEKLPPSP